MEFTIGEAVLADFNGALIPGVVEDERDGKLLVRLATPWTNESGNQSSEAWLAPERLSRNEESEGTQALPG